MQLFLPQKLDARIIIAEVSKWGAQTIFCEVSVLRIICQGFSHCLSRGKYSSNGVGKPPGKKVTRRKMTTNCGVNRVPRENRRNEKKDEETFMNERGR